MIIEKIKSFFRKPKADIGQSWRIYRLTAKPGFIFCYRLPLDRWASTVQFLTIKYPSADTKYYEFDFLKQNRHDLLLLKLKMIDDLNGMTCDFKEEGATFAEFYANAKDSLTYKYSDGSSASEVTYSIDELFARFFANEKTKIYFR